MARTLLFAALGLALHAAAQTGPATGFAEGAWNSGLYEQHSTGRVVLFPNPASSQLSVAFPGLTGEAIVTIVGADGRMVRREQVNETAAQRWVADVEDLPDGQYVVNVEQEGDRVTERLVVMH